MFRKILVCLRITLTNYTSEEMKLNLKLNFCILIVFVLINLSCMEDKTSLILRLTNLLFLINVLIKYLCISFFFKLYTFQFKLMNQGRRTNDVGFCLIAFCNKKSRSCQIQTTQTSLIN